MPAPVLRGERGSQRRHLARNTASFGYDAAGHRTTAKDPAGNTTTSTYDPAGNLTSVTDAASNKTTYGYDKNNRLTNTVSPRGNVPGATAATYTTTYGYDAVHRVTSATDPLGGKVSYGHTTIATNARGTTATVTYDPRGLATATTYSDATAPTSRSHDKTGRQASVTDATGTRTMGYDPAGPRRTRNCGRLSVALDQLLSGKNPPSVSSEDHPLYREEVQALAQNGTPFVQKGGLSGLVNDMVQWGPGARAIVGGFPSDAKAKAGAEGHYFNVINGNGVIVFLDSQTGKASPEGWGKYFIMRTH